MSRFGLLSALASLLVLAAPTLAQTTTFGFVNQYLINGGFESGSLSPWIAGGQGVDTVAIVQAGDGYPIHSGKYALAFGGGNNFSDPATSGYGASITQLVPKLQEFGELLYLSFFLGSPTNQPQLEYATYSFNGGPATRIPFGNLTYGYPYGNFTQINATLYGAPGHLPSDVQYGSITIGFFANAPVDFVIDDIVLSGPTVAIVGDPQFVGLRGQHYQVHGIDNMVYNLVSAPALSVNSRFVFLSGGSCPLLNGQLAHNCWSHPGSYLGSIGIQQVVDGVVHQLEIVSGNAVLGFSRVAFDGQVLAVGGQMQAGSELAVSFTSSHQVEVRTSLFSFVFENSDLFINQQLSATVSMSELAAQHVHGLLGQTHQRRVYDSQVKYIEGDVDDYVVEENELFGVDSVYKRFQQ